MTVTDFVKYIVCDHLQYVHKFTNMFNNINHIIEYMHLETFIYRKMMYVPHVHMYLDTKERMEIKKKRL